MRSNTKNSIENGVVKAGEFSYSKKPRTLKAYGREYEIPVKTIEFSDKIVAAAKAIANTAGASSARDTAEKIKSGIALFIGEEEAERIFPAENFDRTDIDEITSFWLALNAELVQGQEDLITRYTKAKAMKI